LHSLQASAGIAVRRIQVRSTTRADVSALAFAHRIQVEELAEVGESLEDTLLQLTATATECAAA
jgi:myo-inositol catabolism protein IolC